MLLATSLADWTNWRLATGLAVRDEARRQVLHRADVCLATMVAADKTCGGRAGQTHLFEALEAITGNLLPTPGAGLSRSA